MKLAILSDVHGNCLALDTVLAEIEKVSVDHIICNGDMIQSGPQPAETVACLREMKYSVVMGNSDAWLLSDSETNAHLIPEDRRQKLNFVREWSPAQLSEADKAFIAAFQPTVEISLGNGGSLLTFHGSPTNFDQFILPSTPEDEFKEIPKPDADNVLIGGHMHPQYTRRLRDSQNFFFNPSTVGVAYNHEQSGAGLPDAWCEYAMLTVVGPQVSCESRRLPLDMEWMTNLYAQSDQSFADEAMGQY